VLSRVVRQAYFCFAYETHLRSKIVVGSWRLFSIFFVHSVADVILVLLRIEKFRASVSQPARSYGSAIDKQSICIMSDVMNLSQRWRVMSAETGRLCPIAGINAWMVFKYLYPRAECNIISVAKTVSHWTRCCRHASACQRTAKGTWFLPWFIADYCSAYVW